jgi:integrase
MASITKRGNFWRGQIIRRGYPPQYGTFDTRSQAEAWARALENEMDRGIFVSRGESERTTLREALDRYWLEIACKKSHPYQEKQRIERWKLHELAHYHLAKLRGSDFAQYRDARLNAGRATNTVRLELAIISHLFEIARKEWGMEGLLNPLKNIRKPSGSQERDRRLREGEYEKLTIALGESSNPWVKPLFQFAIETSLRQGMLFELRWDWIDLSRQVVMIPAQFRAKGNKVVPAALPLSKNAVHILQMLPRSIDGKVFATTQNAVVCVWKKTLKRIGIEGLRWHDLRHEAASRLFEKGLHPIEVASVTGHKNLNMLKRYTHLNPEALAQKLG